MQRKQTILTVLFCLALSAQAQTNTVSVRSLTLRECIALSLQNNLTLKARQISPQIAAFDVRAAYGAFDPVLTLQANRVFENQPADFQPDRIRNEDNLAIIPGGLPPFVNAPNPPPNLNMVVGVNNPYELTTDSVGGGLMGKLPFGTMYGFNTRVERREDRTFPYPGEWFHYTGTSYFFATEQGTNNYYTVAALTLKQPLLRNLWIDADRMNIQVSKENLKLSREVLRADLITNVVRVQITYYNLVAAKELVKSEQEALSAAKRLYAETKQKVDNGVLPKLMERQAEMLVATVEADLLAAQQTYLAEQNQMKNQLTDRYAEWVDVRIEPSESLLVISERPKLADCWETALKHRPELAEERAILARARVVTKYANNQRFPDLSVTGSVGWNAADSGFTGVANSYFEGAQTFYGVGASVSMPLSNIRARNNYKAAQAAQEQANYRLKAAQQTVLMEVDTALKDLEYSLQRVTATEKATEYAKQALDAEQMKLENNASTPYLVQLAQRDLLTARATQIQARANYNRSRAAFDQAQGITLERQNINLNFK